MRPDEHKKKKNAQYKKKHGLPDKENKADVKLKGSVNERKEKPPNVSGDSAKLTKEVKPEDKNVTVKLKAEETEEVSKHYGRRKLESNWSRYEEDSVSEEEDDIPLQRGEDFNKLLAQAGGSESQFRFKDEEDWNVDSQTTTTTTTTVLALDFENLSQSLDCIPLHERLGIDDKLFTEEQINEMKAYSAEQENAGKANGGTTTNLTKTDNKMKAKDKSPKTVSGLIKTEVKTDSSAIDSKASENNHVAVVQKEKIEVKSTFKQENKDSKVRTKEVEILEDDLDMILSLEEKVDTKDNFVNKKDKIRNDTSEINGEKAIAIHVESTKTAMEKTNDAKGSDNLEDWLDSVLDD